MSGWGSLCGLREYITDEPTDTCLLCCNNRIYLFYIFFSLSFLSRVRELEPIEPDPVWRCRLVGRNSFIFAYCRALFYTVIFSPRFYKFSIRFNQQVVSCSAIMRVSCVSIDNIVISDRFKWFTWRTLNDHYFF